MFAKLASSPGDGDCHVSYLRLFLFRHPTSNLDSASLASVYSKIFNALLKLTVTLILAEVGS